MFLFIEALVLLKIWFAMKKWILVLCFFILAMISTFYVLVPATKAFTFGTAVACTEKGAERLVTNKDRWQAWWPGKKTGNNIYSYEGCNYRIDKIMLNGFETTILNGNDSVKAKFQIIADGTDNAIFQWSSVVVLSNNPVKKIFQYISNNGIQNNIEKFAAAIKPYFENEENIYGMKVVSEKVTETAMVSVKQTFNHYPSTEEVYGMIYSLQGFIKLKGGEESNYPMLNVHTEDSATYDVMTAIPTKTDLPSEGNFYLKKMMLGNILMAEIKGGPYTIKKGVQELTRYVTDHSKTSPAIPFQSLVTDRLLETDTSKWVTKLYYPIFY